MRKVADYDTSSLFYHSKGSLSSNFNQKEPNFEQNYTKLPEAGEKTRQLRRAFPRYTESLLRFPYAIVG